MCISIQSFRLFSDSDNDATYEPGDDITKGRISKREKSKFWDRPSTSKENNLDLKIRTFNFEVNTANRVSLRDLFTKNLRNITELGDSSVRKTKLIAMIMNSRGISEEIREQRKLKRYFIKFGTFTVNVSDRPGLILNTDLTKTRMMAIVHRAYMNTLNEDEMVSPTLNCSPLIARVVFPNGHYLLQFRALMGLGFYYQHDLFVNNMAYYYAICLLLDFLAYRFNPENKDNTGMDEYNSPFQFFVDGHWKNGTNIVAGARNMGDTELKGLKNQEILQDIKGILEHLSVDPNLGGARMRVRANADAVTAMIPRN